MGYTQEQIDAFPPELRQTMTRGYQLMRALGVNHSDAVKRIDGQIRMGQSIERFIDKVQWVVEQYRVLVPARETADQSEGGTAVSASTSSEAQVNQLRDLGYSSERIDTIKPEIRSMVANFHRALSSLGVSQERILNITQRLQTLDSLIDKVEWIFNSLKGASTTSSG